MMRVKCSRSSVHMRRNRRGVVIRPINRAGLPHQKETAVSRRIVIKRMKRILAGLETALVDFNPAFVFVSLADLVPAAPSADYRKLLNRLPLPLIPDSLQ